MSNYTHSSSSSADASPRLKPIDTKSEACSNDDVDSGYSSAASSTMGLPAVTFTPYHLKWLNDRLETMEAQDILRFCKVLFPNLYQSTAFGLTGLVTLDMLSKLEKEDARPVDIIFLDTLYHFKETLDLIERVEQRYPSTKVHIYKPDGCNTAAEFEAIFGERAWETSAEMYDWYAKVEPQQRAYTELNVAAVFTGRRRSQGGQRDKIPIVEVDEERGVIKINPLVNWSFEQVRRYIKENDVPYNALLDQGYKSVGDWHSTSPVAAGEDERAGRWKGQAKTECGIHNQKSRYALYLEEMEQKKREQAMAKAFQDNQERINGTTVDAASSSSPAQPAVQVSS